MVKNAYDGSSIQILDGLDVVRRRSDMYIGSTGSRGLHHLVWEIVDNSIDEVLNGHGDTICITIEKDNVICVEGEGRDMPVDTHAGDVPTMQVIYTVLHAGGKFNTEDDYKASGGLHGTGTNVINALSEQVEVTVHHGGKIYRMSFSDGGHEVSKLEAINKTSKARSKVRFKVGKTMLSTMKYSFHQIAEHAQRDAFLLEDLKLVIRNRHEGKERGEVCHYEQGLVTFMEYPHEGKQVFHKPVAFSGMSNNIKVGCAFQYTDEYQENIFSFVNIICTKDGGAHETGAKNASIRVFNEYARGNGLLREKGRNFEGSDVRGGLTITLSLGVPENPLQFERQTKGKLGMAEAKTAVNSIVSEKLSFFLEENKEPATTLIKEMRRASTAREAAHEVREDAHEGKIRGKTEEILSGKLASAQGKDTRKKELYPVEGDSAKGSARQGRDNKCQAILPLCGKVLNTEKANITDIEKNGELNIIIHALGTDTGTNFHAGDSNYHKVIIMTDADTDGAHIQILLLTFFYRYMRELTEQDIVYIALPPLYRLQKGREIQYTRTDEELDEPRKTFPGGFSLQRYRGLGEVNADQLWDTTVRPGARTLIQVTIDDAVVAEKCVSVLMGDKVNLRRDWIEENASFTLEGDYEVGARR